MYIGGNFGAAVVSGIQATPTYASGNGWQSWDGGQYALAAGTPGFDQGVRIPNFNDGFLGAAPDVGAAESGAAAMKFGLAAADSTGSTSGGTTPPPPPTPPPTTPPPTTPPPTTAPPPTTSNQPVSTTMDSSSYTITAGTSVTFTTRVLGNYGTPTGTGNFKANHVSIAGCSAAAIANGRGTFPPTPVAARSLQSTRLYSRHSTHGHGRDGAVGPHGLVFGAAGARRGARPGGRGRRGRSPV